MSDDFIFYDVDVFNRKITKFEALLIDLGDQLIDAMRRISLLERQNKHLFALLESRSETFSPVPQPRHPQGFGFGGKSEDEGFLPETLSVAKSVTQPLFLSDSDLPPFPSRSKKKQRGKNHDKRTKNHC